MTNTHAETDIALLLMQLEEEVGDSKTIYGQIHAIFEGMRAEGDDIPTEFCELEKELDMKYAA